MGPVCWDSTWGTWGLSCRGRTTIARGRERYADLVFAGGLGRLWPGAQAGRSRIRGS